MLAEFGVLLDAGLFEDRDEEQRARAFGELVLGRMVEGRWMANFASLRIQRTT